jgi:predicted nucleic acid-binding protein
VYLVDTNIWLERLLDQDRSAEVGDFLQRIPNDRLYLTDFTLHSIGIILVKLGEAQTFSRFVQDVLIDGAVRLVGLEPDDMASIVDAATGKYRLDFDDAYQYAASAKFNFQIVSFDSDFDRTDRVRRLPEQVEREQQSDSKETPQE